MDPAILEALQQINVRLGQLQDAVDDLRLSSRTAATNHEALLTAVDTSLRDIVAQVDAKVATMHTEVEAIRGDSTITREKVEAAEVANQTLLTNVQTVMDLQLAEAAAPSTGEEPVEAAFL